MRRLSTRAFITLLAVTALGLGACEGTGSGLIGTITGSGGGGSNTNPLLASVNITNFAFSPNSVRIRPGGTVTWIWNTADTTTHNVTFSNSTFNSGNKRGPGAHAVTFTTGGTYSYQCTIHSGMTGAVTVN